MRQIGSLQDEHQAQRLADYLFTLGIRSRLEAEEGALAIWVMDEDRVPEAREEFQRFIQNPADERYSAAERQAQQLRDDLISKEKQRQRNIVTVRGRWNMPSPKGLTFVLIVISCAVGFATDFGDKEQWDKPVLQALSIDSFVKLGDHWFEKKKFSRAWDVFHGQLWRLVTPIFLHFGLVHLVMNMMALHSLGKLIESRFGTPRLAWLVLVIAVVSNLSQYAWNGPSFGGMSGVVFGLFGYVWIRSEFDPSAGFRITRSSIVMMLGWMILCFTGYVGPIANAAHFMGLVMGILLGYGPVISRRILGR